MSEPLESRVLKAKTNSSEAEQLLNDYLPFIKKTITEKNKGIVGYDDMLTIAMAAFMNSIQAYDKDRGSFLAFTATLIHNRLIDEERKELKYTSRIVPFPMGIREEGDCLQTAEEKTSILQYDKELERKNLCVEINEFSNELENYGINFSELPKISPKWDKSRHLCADLAREVVKRKELRLSFQKLHRIPQKELADALHISPKTIEKHRKYIVTLVVLMQGDYPHMHTFIPKNREAAK